MPARIFNSTSFKHTLVDATVWKKHQISLVLGKNANKIL